MPLQSQGQSGGVGAHVQRPFFVLRNRHLRSLRSLFRFQTPVVERSAPGYRIAPSHLIFTEPMSLRAAARLALTSPLAEKTRRRRAWRSHGRHRVRIRSSRVAIAPLPLFGTFSSPSPPLDSPAPPLQYTLRSPPQHYKLGAPTGATSCGNAAAASTPSSSLPSPPLHRVRHCSSRVAVASRSRSAGNLIKYTRNTMLETLKFFLRRRESDGLNVLK
jgi:hypothetical protein